MQRSAVSTARRFRALVVVAVCLVIAALPATGGAHGLEHVGRDGPSTATWAWPVDSPRISQAYEAPAHRYGPGHRGIDLEPAVADDAGVFAPADGTVAFAGAVAGRGVLTIDHGYGLVSTLEPVDTSLTPGTAVAKGEEVGSISLGGHTAPGAVHFGVRRHGEYINPLLLVGGVPRAVLLPCC